jgi:hypothetical protein
MKNPIILSLLAVVLAFMMVSCSNDNPFEAPPQNGSLDNAAVTSLEKGGRKTVAFKGSFETTFQIIPLVCVKDGAPVDCGTAGAIPVVVSTPGEGAGKVSKLGRLTVSFEQTVDFTTTPPSLSGTDEFTAANGDKLFATHTGTSTGPDADGNDRFTSGEFIFTGGTGKFKGASGSATITSGVANIPTLKAQFSIRGKIKLRDDDDDDDDD